MANTDDVLRIALALPEVDHKPWSDLIGVRVCGKGFTYLYEGAQTAVIKATLAEQAALVATNPDVYAKSRVSSRFGWVSVKLSVVSLDELAEILTEAWRLTAPRRLVAAFAPDD
jgi:hypothetical protein